MSHITIVQTSSPIGRPADHRSTLKGLGLGKIGRHAKVLDTPANRGMIKKVAHLLRVVEGSQS